MNNRRFDLPRVHPLNCKETIDNYQKLFVSFSSNTTGVTSRAVNTTGATSGAVTANLSGVSEFTHGFSEVRVARLFCVVFNKLLFVLFIVTMYCMSIFDLRLSVTPSNCTCMLRQPIQSTGIKRPILNTTIITFQYLLNSLSITFQ